MFRACLIILILHLGLVFQGCAALEYLDGSSKEEIEKFKMSKEEMWDKMVKLKKENINLQGEIKVLANENQRTRGENENKMARMRDQNDLLNEQKNKLKEENQGITAQNQALAKKLNRLQVKHKTFSSESYDLEEDIRKIKIKVLSGDGNLNSAKKMARRLKKMGYEIKRIDHAPESDVLRDVVFFAPKFRYEAKRLASSLGGKMIAKPLSWFSIFDLILVTGKNPR